MKIQKLVENEWKDTNKSELEVGDVFREINNDGLIKEDKEENTTFDVTAFVSVDLFDPNYSSIVCSPKTIFID